MESIYIVSGVRTAIGDFGGSLKDIAPSELGAKVLAEAVSRAGIAPADVQHVLMGQAIPTVPADSYIARAAALKAGLPIEAPALSVNRLCGSGLQAIISAAQLVALGEADVVAAAGTEVMSKSPHYVLTGRFGQKMGDIKMIDAMLGVLSDPMGGYHMGITAENMADDLSISRETQDALAVESHRRAALAQAEGRFKDQILPVEIKTRKGPVMFDTDEHVKASTTTESLAALKPAFKDGGSVTAGNASGINDGAAAVILASQAAVDAKGLKPMAKVLGWGYAGVEPRVMGMGPTKAVPIALKRAGLTLDQIDVIEANEAFAAQACGVAQTLGFDPEKVNPNGSGISLGHPVGATGVIIMVKCLYELARTGGRYGLVTMCIGGGQGIAMVVERV